MRSPYLAYLTGPAVAVKGTRASMAADVAALGAVVLVLGSVAFLVPAVFGGSRDRGSGDSVGLRAFPVSLLVAGHAAGVHGDFLAIERMSGAGGQDRVGLAHGVGDFHHQV